MLIQCIERKCSFWHNLGNALGQNYGPESDRAEESAILLNLRKYIFENLIVVLYTIIQINTNHLIRQVMDSLFVLTNFCDLCLQGCFLLIKFYFLTAACTHKSLLNISNCCTIT